MKICPDVIEDDPYLKNKIWIVHTKNTDGNIRLVYAYTEKGSAESFIEMMNHGCTSRNGIYYMNEVLLVR